MLTAACNDLARARFCGNDPGASEQGGSQPVEKGKIKKS